MSRRDRVKAIDTVEARLQLDAEKAASTGETNDETLSARGKVIYMIVRGDNYSHLASHAVEKEHANPKYKERIEEFLR